MTDKTLYTVRLPKDVITNIREVSVKRHISNATLLTEILRNHFEHSGRKNTSQSDTSISYLCLRVETKKALMKKARYAGMSADEYIRYLLEPKQLFELKMVVNDLQELNTCFRDLVTTLNAVAKVMLQTNTAYDVQVDRIFTILEDIHELFSNTYFQEREQRNELLGIRSAHFSNRCCRSRRKTRTPLRLR